MKITVGSKDHSKRSAFASQLSENQLRSGERVFQKLFRSVAGPLQQIASEVKAKNKQGKKKLEKKAEQHGF
jgi:hypothetical protein